MDAAIVLGELRASAGLSLRALADAADTSHSALAAYEAARKSPTARTMFRIIDAAGYAVDFRLAPRRRGTEHSLPGTSARRAVSDSPHPRHDMSGVSPPADMTAGPTSIIDKIVELHLALEAADIAHAFGGALALAWCTEQARGTIDIDVNLFVGLDQVDNVLASVPAEVEVTDQGRTQLKRDGQTRLWWQKTPLDLFMNTTPFHEAVGRRVRIEDFNGQRVPFLACRDIAVFKALFSRDKDWTDLREMARAGTLDFEAVLGVLALQLEGFAPSWRPSGFAAA